jgi:hypothetical protein
MALLHSVNLEHIPTTHTVHIALFRDIKNASFLHQQLLAGNTEFEYALIDASVVSHLTSLLPSTTLVCVLALSRSWESRDNDQKADDFLRLSPQRKLWRLPIER